MTPEGALAILLSDDSDQRVIIGPLVWARSDGKEAKLWSMLVAGRLPNDKLIARVSLCDMTQDEIAAVYEWFSAELEDAGREIFKEAEEKAVIRRAAEFWPHPEWATKLSG